MRALRKLSPPNQRSYSTCLVAKALQQVSQARRNSRTRSSAEAVSGSLDRQELRRRRNQRARSVEILDGEPLYAIRIVRPAENFNLCPADLCQLPIPAADAALGACPVGSAPGLVVTRYDAPAACVETAQRLTRAASIDVGGVEYLVSAEDGHAYFYDVNATSNFVANAPEVLGFDPFVRLADYIVRVATR